MRWLNASYHISFCAMFSLLNFSASFCQAEVPTKLLRWIPADANSVMVIDADAFFHAPLAVRENWRKQADDRFVNQEVSIPPETRRMVVASQLDLGGGMQPVWELNVLELEKTPSFALIARREGGHLDTISGHSAISLPTGRTGIELESGVVMVTPQPNRQVISRWIGAVKPDASPKLSTYLAKGLQDADPKSQVVLVMDLADSVTVPPIRAFLEKFEPLKGKTADQADIAEIIASIKGLVLTVRVTDKREGAIKIEFGKPTTIMKPLAKELVNEILGAMGIALADMDHWSAKLSDNAIHMEGEFTAGDLRKVASLFAATPATREIRETVPDSEAKNPDAVKAEASKKYFHSVKSLLEELRKTLDKAHRDNQLVWLERYARKIDDLPLKDVDKDLLTFGGNVTSSLRYQAQASRMAAVRGGVRAAQPVYQNYSYGAGAIGPYGTYGGYSFSGAVQVSPNFGQIRTEERATASQVRVSEMKQIEDGLSQIRRAMTERYHVEF